MTEFAMIQQQTRRFAHLKTQSLPFSTCGATSLGVVAVCYVPDQIKLTLIPPFLFRYAVKPIVVDNNNLYAFNRQGFGHLIIRSILLR